MSGIIRNFVVKACNAFTINESRAKVWEISRRVEWFPPNNGQWEREARAANSSPEVVKVIRVRAAEETLKSKCLWGSTTLRGGIEEICEPV